ncbi:MULTISPECIES: hypothetical protein [unclassified Cryobacterium]|uniref:hypothetical protein n=1 Tax=unclassified Cryobacterium TaxID=2649013 RepID=UPI000CE2E8CC|nr:MULTISPECIES: hypothetical protein [unclassified Cryobacterium]
MLGVFIVCEDARVDRLLICLAFKARGESFATLGAVVFQFPRTALDARLAGDFGDLLALVVVRVKVGTGGCLEVAGIPVVVGRFLSLPLVSVGVG